jgi:hypothetical protein
LQSIDQMNLRRGLFRIWVVSSLFWLAGWLSFSQHSLARPVGSGPTGLALGRISIIECGNLFSHLVAEIVGIDRSEVVKGFNIIGFIF